MVIWSLCSVFGFLVLWRPSGSLSCPQNMSVQFQDFYGRLHWLQGPGNPSNTHYSVQLRVIGEKVWRFPRNCKDIVAMECALDIPLTNDDLWKSYEFKVRAEGTNQSSAWSHLAFIVQPYWETLLSAPSMRLWVKDQNVYMSLTHQQTVLPNLHFNIVLLQRTGSHNTTVAEDVKSPSKRVFSNLPPGYHYCLIASANHHSRHGRHMTTKDCVYLPKVSPDVRVGVGMSVGVFVLLAVLIVLTRAICLSQNTRDHNPTALGVYVGPVECVLIPETVICEPVRLQAEWTQPESYYSVYQARASIASLTISRGDRQETEAVLPPSPAEPTSPSAFPFISPSISPSPPFSHRVACDSEDNEGYTSAELLDGDTDGITDKQLLQDRHTDRGRTPDRWTVLLEGCGDAGRERDCAAALQYPDLCDLQLLPLRQGEGEEFGVELGVEMGCQLGAEEVLGYQEEVYSPGASLCSLSGYEPHPDPCLTSDHRPLL